MRSPRTLLGGLALLFVACNLAATLDRSAIPLGLDGTVDQIVVRTEKHPGVDDVHLVYLGKRVVHLDAAVAERLRPRDRVRKRPWSRTLQTPRGPLRLTPSADFRGMAVLMPLLALLAAAMRRRATPRTPD